MISLTSKAPGKRTHGEGSYSVYVYPNISRELMGANNPYIQHLKQAVGEHALEVDPAIADQAFPDLLKKGFRSDMIIFNWLENLPSRRMGVLQTMVVLALLPLLKARGVKIVWIKHNKISHTKKWFAVSRMIHAALLRYSDHIIAHSRDIGLPDSHKMVYLPHPSNIDREDILRPNGSEEPLIDLLIWGSLLPYKGVLEFLQYAAEDAGLRQLTIHVIGKSSAEYWELLQKYAGSNVTLINRFIPEEEIPALFEKTRFILFTYNKRSVMSSGILADSLAACKKIIAPDCGAFADLAEQHSFVHLYNDLSEITSICRDHYEDYTLDYEEVCAFVEQNSWFNMGQKIKELAGGAFCGFILFLLSFLTTMAASAQSAATTLYVATNGQAGNPGTQDKPFQRPEQALDAARNIKGDVTIYIRGGTYAFTKSLTLSNVNPDGASKILVSAFQNEKVIFSGGQKLDNGQFRLVTDPEILNRLPAVARGKVYVIDLKKSGITNYGQEQPHGYKLIRTAPLELFYNGDPLTVARYPNEGYLPIGKVSDPGANPRMGDHSGRGATFSFGDNRMNNWKGAHDAWVGGYLSYGYSDDYLKVDSFDVNAKTIRLKQAAMYSVFSTDNTSNEILRNSEKIRGFYVYNLLEELDTPGEWYLDRSAGLLYCWPPEKITALTDLEVSLLEGPLMVLSGTQNVHFDKISFEYGRDKGIVIENTKNTQISHCAFSNLGTVGIYTDNLKPSPVYNTGLLIQSCTISNTGTGGVILTGGDRKTLQSSHNVIDNCEIYNYSRINRTFCPAVSLNGVGNQVTHCYIHDAPDQAIMFYGNDLEISYNRISKVTYYMTDAGAVGTGRDLGTTGITIDYNLFENITSSIGSSLCALYLDDGSSGMKVEGNIFYKAGTGGTYHFGAVHINGGTDNVFRNDEFIDCEKAFSNSQWTDAKWKSLVTDSSVAKVYRPGVDIRSALYQQKYPVLVKMADSNALTPRQNYTFNILAYHVGVLSTGTGIVNKNAFVTQEDPGFANEAGADLNLTKTPAQLSQAGDWKPAPFGEMGLQKK